MSISKDPNDKPVKVKKFVTKVKGGYKLRSKFTGKDLGVYKNKKAVKKRIAQIEYFKHGGKPAAGK
jgi:hypothetical protein